MPSESQTENGDGIADSGLRNADLIFNPQSIIHNPQSKLRVDSLSVSDAVIVLAAAHRLCEERDSLRRVYMKVLEREMVEVKRGIWTERVVWVLVVVLSLLR